MCRAILVIVALTLLWSERAFAIDGNKLYEACEFFGPRIPTSPADANQGGYCIGFIQGVRVSLGKSGIFCVPTREEGVTGGQVGYVVKLYLREHPELRHFSAADLVAAALKEKFPCN
jgi:hypothetical protein